VNGRRTLATAGRVLTQLRHDPRTVALMVVVPSVLMTMLRYVFDSKPFFSHVAPALLGFFPFLLMFLVTVITTLRERSSGTLERLLTTPMGRLDPPWTRRQVRPPTALVALSGISAILVESTTSFSVGVVVSTCTESA